MATTLGMIAIVIDEYDAAISHYVNDLGFTLIEDTELSPEKRWVVIAPSSAGAQILLAQASNEQQQAAIGNATGERYLAKGIEFTETPRNESFGQVVVLKDKYGNKWDLIENKVR
jgi:uroporphyrinogen-III synthase